ncbi:hypothetical protein [Prevotella sp. P2-180]|uniref:hypothetical protein n=1 Tax=Prevotella sp. P2-180 TaxID=2024224 RepID=UPI000B977A9D|nr:hypothetical protein [Prevotella sp. P2-180]OYP69561.1 hypothetical protein CIK98_00940 [Prevotella sp. P2-180]
MNKVTLSVVALAAIGAPVQSQAADQTEAEKLQATYDEVCGILNTAINEVNGYHEAVKAEYLNKLSNIQKEIDAAKTAGTIDKAYFDGVISTVKADALTRENQYDGYDVIKVEFDKLTSTYEKALTTVQNGSYPNVGAKKKAWLESDELGYPALKARVDALDPATQDDIFGDKMLNMWFECYNMNKSVQTMLKGLDKEEANAADSEASYQDVVDVITALKETYNVQLQALLKILPGDPDVYGNWQAKAIDELNEEYRKILDVEKKNAAAREAGNANVISSENMSTLAIVEGNIGSISDKWEQLKNAEEAAYKARKEDVDTLNKNLKAITDELSKRSLSELDGDINTIQTKINTVASTVESRYKANTVSKLNITKSQTEINKLISELNKKAKPIIDNYDANADIIAELEAQYKTLEDAKKAADALSDDGNYKASDYFTESYNTINTKRQAIIAAAKNALDTKTSVDYKASAKYKKAMAEVDGLIKTYAANTTASLSAYNTAAKTIADAQALVDKYAKLADLTVTTDGQVKNADNETYQEVKEDAENEIGDIKTQITKAKAKKDAAHKAAMEQAAALSVRGDLQTYLDKYDNNKAEFDKNSAIAAADNILAEADARIDDLKARIAKAEAGDLGNMATEVTEKTTPLQEELGKLTDDVAATRKTYNDAADDKKAEEAQKTISKLSDVNNALDELEPKVVEAENLAIKAKNNKAAYDATKKAVTDSSIDGKLVAAQTYITANTNGDGQMFYLQELAKLKNSVDALNKAIEKSYGEKKSVDNKDGHINTLNSLVTAVSDLQTNALANETMHSAQVEKMKTLQSDWQKAYTSISEKDESTQAKDYLAQLGTLQDGINALNTNIAKAFATGTSKAKDSEFAAEITRITNEINNIVKAQEEGYDAAITADNIAQHNKFISQYNAAYKMYQDAVAALNEFAKIQNPVLVKALQDLVPTHDAIYEYADKLRLLNADESADYATYKAPKLYSSATWVDKADLYEAEIDANLKKYQDAVNKIALDNYTDEIKAAVKKLADAKDAIKDYTYKDKKNAFADVDAFVGAAQTAAGLTDKEVDRMFATKIDGWLSQFKNVDNMIDADKEAAADNEFTYQHTNFTNLYNSEKAEIAKLANLTQDYLAQLAKRKQSSINYAYDMFVYRVVNSGNPLPAEKKFVRLPDCLKELKKYYAENGTPVVVDKKNHSDIYKKAVDESKYNTANLEAYDAIIAIIDGVSDKGSVGAEAIDPLFNVHVAGSKIYGEYSSILEDIEDFYKDAETWKGNGSCVANKTTAENRAKNIEKAINDIKIPAIDAEIPALRGEIDRVKEEYNKAATQSADLLEKVKVYDAQIEALYRTLDATPTKENPNNKGIQYKWANERSKYGFDAAKADLVKLQSEISRVGRELTALYDAAAQETALAELNARAEELEALLKDFTEKAEYHKDINDKYGADLDDFKAYLEGVKADVEAKNAAGDILFHKNNLLADFDRAEAEFSYVAGLNKMYNKYVTNDKVYNTLKAGFEALQKQLDDLKTLADGFHASSLVKIKDPVTGEFVYVEYRNNQYEVISATIKTELNDLAKSHDAINLTAKDLKGATDEVSAKIVEYEKTIKYDEARLCWLKDLHETYLDAANNLRKNLADNQLYGGNRYNELVNRMKQLDNAHTNAKAYNDAAFWNGSIANDIDGKDVRVKNEETGDLVNIEIDYLEEAWPTLQAKVETLLAEANQLAKDVNDFAYIKGDADNDKKVTVNDYSTVRNWILTATAFEDVSESQRYAGDVDGNKQFTVADMTQISNIIFYGNPLGKQEEAAGAKGQLTVVDNDEITLVKESEETSVFGKTIRVAVNVAHNVAFTAGQFDVKLPEGMKIASQSLTERGNGHELLCNEIGNGLYRMVAATIDNTKFNGRTGALVLIDVEVSGSYTGGEISVSNVIFSDANGISYSIVGPGNDGETTGIDGVTAPTVKERIYSIGGQMKKALKKGINIIVGEDGKGHKVVK